MKPIKLSNSVEFDVIYADGSRRRVTEGVLFEATNEKMIFHKGTSRKEVIFASQVALLEVITDMGLLGECGLYLINEGERRERIPKNETVRMVEKETVCNKCGKDVTAEEYAKIQLWSPGRAEGGQRIALCLGCYLKLMRFLQEED